MSSPRAYGPFAPEVEAAVVDHMNDDHASDALLICQGLGSRPQATAAAVTRVDLAGMHFVITDEAGVSGIVVPWSTDVTERVHLRHEAVRMVRESAELLGRLLPADHDGP